MKPELEEGERLVPGYSKFSVNANGDVFSWLGLTRRKLKPGIGTTGYGSVIIKSDSGRRHGVTVHKIMAMTWLTPIEGKTIVNHINGIKTDNRSSNLEYMTSRENSLHAHKTGLWKGHARPVFQIDPEGNIIGKYVSIIEASRKTGISNTKISGACQTYLSASKYFWCYEENYFDGIFSKSHTSNLVSKAVRQIAPDGTVIAIHKSMQAASDTLEIDRKKISEVCKGKRDLVGGYKWEFTKSNEHLRVLREKPREDKRKLEEETSSWKILDEFPQYRISRDGNIYSPKMKTLMRQQQSTGGYKFLGLVDKNKKHRTIYIHRLVATAYLPNANPQITNIINHLDGNPGNNTVKNLSWTTSSGNTKHAVAMGRSRGKKINEYEDGKFIRAYLSIADMGRQLDIDEWVVRRKIEGKTKKGRSWNYATAG